MMVLGLADDTVANRVVCRIVRTGLIQELDHAIAYIGLQQVAVFEIDRDIALEQYVIFARPAAFVGCCPRPTFYFLPPDGIVHLLHQRPLDPWTIEATVIWAIRMTEKLGV